MENLAALAVIALVGLWLFREGKKLGSRKGYGVGRFRSKRRRN